VLERARRGAIAVLLALVALPLLAWKNGDTLPKLDGLGLEGNVPALAGKVVLLDFWASWCGPCKKSFPELDKIQQAYKDKGLVILAVNVDEKADDMESFLKDHPVTFAVVRDAKQKLVAAAGVESMPTSLLVDAKGVIRFQHTGFHGEETVKQLKGEIEKLLAGK
jgi:thiol-disulfide isomerase/thioredoxin